jgi:hypothetical protein
MLTLIKKSGDAARANEEINTALQLAPNHPLVLKSAYNVHSILGDEAIQIGPGYFDVPSLGPTQEPLPPLFNLAAIPGTYQINEVTYYGKNVQLTFKLRSDFSATMEMKFEDGQKYTASGRWKPGDINISLSLVDQFKEPMAFDPYVEESPSHNLVITNNQSVYFFGDQARPDLINVGYPTPSSTLTNTPAPTITLRPPRTFTPSGTPGPSFTPLPTKTSRPTLTFQPTPSQPASTPAPKAPSSLCGSAMLIPLIANLWLGRKRITTSK